jgi:1,2-dihydroxy-3-keto-5-methylthiopentene dioxygenase
MALLQLDDGIIYTDLEEIAGELAPLRIHLRHFEPGTSLLFPDLFDQDTLTELEKRHILELHESLFEFLKRERCYLWSDLLNVHPGSPHLQPLMATYNRYHVHTAAEALYVLAGGAIFGFVRPDGSQVQLLVQPQDYLHISAGVEHGFSLDASLQFKAVRYFTTVEGWVPQYTKTQMGDFLGKRR